MEVYSPCEGKETDEFYQFMNEHLVEARQLNKEVLITGDLNGHLQGWFHAQTNTNG